MGKLLVKWGLAIQASWLKFQLKWNYLVSKLMFNVCECTGENCICK